MGEYNAGTPCGVVRNIPSKLPVWEPYIAGDARFWRHAIGNFSGPSNTVMVPRVIYMVDKDLYNRLHELGIDQPRGWFFTEEEGRVLPDGRTMTFAPHLGGVPLSPNPLLKLIDRFVEADVLPAHENPHEKVYLSEYQAQLLRGAPSDLDNFGNRF